MSAGAGRSDYRPGRARIGEPTPQTDPVARYGYERLPNGAIKCSACSACFLPPAEGSVMRSHARRCPVSPRSFPIPNVCDA